MTPCAWHAHAMVFGNRLVLTDSLGHAEIVDKQSTNLIILIVQRTIGKWKMTAFESVCIWDFNSLGISKWLYIRLLVSYTRVLRCLPVSLLQHVGKFDSSFHDEPHQFVSYVANRMHPFTWRITTGIFLNVHKVFFSGRALGSVLSRCNLPIVYRSN